MACDCEPADGLDGGADDAQHAARGVQAGQVFLLNGAQGFGRGGVAGQDDQRAALAKKGLDGLEGVFVDHLEGVRAIGRAGVVAEVQVVVLRHQLSDLPQDGQSAVAGVEDAYRSAGEYVGWAHAVWGIPGERSPPTINIKEWRVENPGLPPAPTDTTGGGEWLSSTPCQVGMCGRGPCASQHVPPRRSVSPFRKSAAARGGRCIGAAKD